MILTERAARLQAEAVAASAKAEAADAKAAEALISYLKLEIEKLRRQIYGSRSISNCSGFICPWPGNDCAASKPNSFTHLRSTFS